ncbi:MAG: hypothetical protein EOP07_12695 [Proteobacteria bacterium]|nr:MAG: hypothetical protein EOP07_12695 [Pseudomonadota bacterium]
MKLFGQFLIDKEIITKDDFVAAMIIQAESLPSLPLAVHELKLFNIDHQVAVFAYQASHFKEYRVAAVEMGLWDAANVEHALGRFFLSRLKPLGEILVEQGCITLNQLSGALEQYVALGDDVYEPEKIKPAPALRVVKENDQTFSDLNVRKIKIPSASANDRSLFTLYCGRFDEAFKARLLKHLRAPSDTDKGSLLTTLRALKYAANFIMAFKSVLLLESLTLAVEQKTPRAAGDQALVERALMYLWTLRAGLSSGEHEMVTLSVASLDSRIEELCFIISRMGDKS